MLSDFSEKEIGAIKDSLSSTISSLLKDLCNKYLENHTTLTREKMIGHEDCYIYRKTWNDEDFKNALNESKKAVKEVLKQLAI